MVFADHEFQNLEVLCLCFCLNVAAHNTQAHFMNHATRSLNFVHSLQI